MLLAELVETPVLVPAVAKRAALPSAVGMRMVPHQAGSGEHSKESLV